MVKKILSIIIVVNMCISVLLCSIVIVKSALGMDKSVLGFRVFYLVSGSMEPTIPTGAAVLVHKSDDYQIDDVITFVSADASIYGYANTHRIIGEMEENGQKAYITKGDANPVADETIVPQDAIYGKVVWHTGRMHWLGTFIGMLTTPLGFITIIILPIMAIVAVLMRDFTNEYKAALAEELASAAQPVPSAEPAQAEQPAPLAPETEENDPEAPA